MRLFDIENLTFAYPDGTDETGQSYLPDALCGVNLHIDRGEFVVVLGSSGCGKTTLLRQMKRAIAPLGRLSGSISFMGQNTEEMSDAEAAAKIGFVQQDVDGQIVTDKVWHELAFGLESLDYDNGYIRRRVAEMCTFFGLSEIFHRKTSELSGGQKQMVNLAAVMAASPEALILDEPTSQLDPIAANEFIGSLVRINRELGTTIIMTEHRLEEVLPVCTRAVVMKDGGILSEGSVREVAAGLGGSGWDRGLYLSLPTAVQVYLGLQSAQIHGNIAAPLTISEGRRWLENYDAGFRDEGGKIQAPGEHAEQLKPRNQGKRGRAADIAIRLDEVSFRYDRDAGDVLRQLSLDVMHGEILMINGSNGSGKSTLLSLIAGTYKPYGGRLRIAKGRTVGMLPQNPEILFTRNSVRNELTGARDRQQLEHLVRFCKLETLLDRHPYDLSGGEKQRLALARVLMHDPDILLMDEPTKGLDNEFKLQLAGMLRRLQAQGKTIVIVSHDIEFCAIAGDRIALLFDGEVSNVSGVRDYLTGNSFFTTAAARMAQGIVDGAVCTEDILAAYGVDMPYAADDEHADLGSDDESGGDGNGGERGADGNTLRGCEHDGRVGKTAVGDTTDGFCESKGSGRGGSSTDRIVLEKEREIEPLSRWQILTISVTSVVIIFCFWKTMSQSNIRELLSGMAVTPTGRRYVIMYAVMICAIAMLLVAIRPITRKRNEDIEMGSRAHRFTRRTVVSIVEVLVLAPLTIWVGWAQLGDRKYYFISLLVMLETMIPFFVSFEGRKTRARDIVTLAVMCALTVTGRVAFIMVPNFNPVVAIVIIAGVAFGCESGFIVGAVSMFVSNFMISQGPWTPWQMFAMGLVGFLAGLFFSRSRVRTRNMTKLGLCIFGAFVCIVVYGGIMNPASVIMWEPVVNAQMILASYVTGFPFDVVQGTATVIFLWLMARPFLEKLDRVRIKYGVL